CVLSKDLYTVNNNDVINNNLRIVGKILKTYNGKDYFAFRGIPYAKPPTGERRFKDPEPYGKWNGLLDARKDGNECAQPSKLSNSTFSEDCLILNVFTKSMQNGNKPVLVYIHGGAYKFGSGSSLVHGPQYLLDEEIVLVTFNYRLGPFGFLSSDSKDATGNFAFKDQVLVLKWVRDNIKHFGGNSDLVTLIGHSAGALSATLHMVSPMSKNLFHRLIALSGSATHHFKAQNFYWTQKLAELVQCPENDGQEMVQCLRGRPLKEIIEACVKFDENRLADLEWNVEIEKDFGQDRFITKDPSILYKNEEFSKIPVLIGITKDEMANQAYKFLLNSKLVAELNENFDLLAPQYFGYNFSNMEESKNISYHLRDFYFKNQKIGFETETNLGNLFSDALIVHGVHRFVQLASQYIDVYFFRLDYRGRYTCSSPRENGDPFYIDHVDILLYLFEYPNCAPEFKREDPEYLIMKKFIKFVINFAESGNPNGDKNKGDELYWVPSKKGNIKTYYIDEISKIDGPPFQDRLTLWDELFPITEK
ncbi:juvenile hormone esterase-like, partial [Condylostylus longicornis]|uniref:juvenile hormone esterase-like n=1 Tax=Condylostylus longicornis TaxID=2530218 RepID=UPI00244DA9B8